MKKFVYATLALAALVFISCGKETAENAGDWDTIATDSLVVEEVAVPHLAFEGVALGSTQEEFANGVKAAGWKWEKIDNNFYKTVKGHSMTLNYNLELELVSEIRLECSDWSSDEGMLFSDAVACYKDWKRLLSADLGSPASHIEKAKENDFYGDSSTKWQSVYETEAGTVTLTLESVPMTVSVVYKDGI